MNPESPDITIWLHKLQGGDKQAEDFVLECLHKELYRLATRYLSSERKGHSLQPTLLVDEAYMRLVQGGNRTWQNRNHFLALAARVMRHFLVDHAKAKLAAKRGGGFVRVEIDNDTASPAQSPEEFLALHMALDRLSTLDPRLAQIVEMHYFGGMSGAEIGSYFNVAERTVKRELSAARAWLADELGANGAAPSGEDSR